MKNLQDICSHPLECLELEIIKHSYFRHFIEFIHQCSYLVIRVLLALLVMGFLLSLVPCSLVSSIADFEQSPSGLQWLASQNLPTQPRTVCSSEKMDLLLRDVISREARAVKGEAEEKKKSLEKSVKLREAEEEIARLKKEALLTVSVVSSQRREIEENQQRREQYKAAIKANGDFLLDMLN